LEIEVPAEEVERNFRKSVKHYQKVARIPGFRSGKIPEALIRNRFASQIRQEVLETILPVHFRKAIEEKDWHPISQPQVSDLDLEQGKPLRFKAVFEVIPDFAISGYEEVRVERPDMVLTDAEFDQELERIRESRATMETVSEDRPLAMGDFAEISFTGNVQKASEEADDSVAEATPIEGQNALIEVGGKNTIESFSAALVGAHAGQQLKFEVSYPEDFGEKKLAGKTVAYDVEVKTIKKKNLPELNDDFAKELGHYESLEDFSNQLRQHLANDKRGRLEAETRNRILEALTERFNFPIPESLVQQQIDTRLDRGLRALAAQGMRTEDMRKLDFNRLRAAQRDSAVAEVKSSVILDRIADEQKIEISDEDVEKELQIVSVQTQEPVDTLRRRLTENGGLARIREQLRRDRTGAMLYEKQSS
jgi:trigger factor